MSLKKQMVLLAVSLIVVSSALNSYLAISSSIRAAEEQALSSALLFSESFAKAAEFGLYTESAPELATAADLISRVPTIAGVSVMDTDGREIYQEMFRPLSEQQLKNVRDGIESLQLSPLGGSHTIRHTRPVYASTFGDIEGEQDETSRTKLGDVALLFEFSPIKEGLRSKVLLTLVTAIAIVFAISLLAYGLAGRLLRPVYDVMVGLRDVSEGNFSHKVTSEAGGELRKLVDGFNVMVDGLRHYRNETVRARDVLEQRVEERTQALLEEKERAESANRTKSEFLARMSHEIRTPMNGVLGMTELLLTSELSASDRRYAETIRNSGTALLHIINDILDFSKIEAGKMELECTQISIRSVAEDVGHMLAQSAQQKGIELAVDVCPSIEPTMMGDEVRLRQILINLMGNAIKFTEQGEVVLRVKPAEDAAMAADCRRYRFEVADTGIGISPDKLSDIFESFTQEDGSTTRRFGGTGLGLAISKQLVGLMGAPLRVKSVLGEGTTFFFEVEMPLSDELTDHDAVTFDQIRALVIDDNSTNVEIIKHQLEAWQVDVYATTDPQDAVREAVERSTSLPYSLALIDAHMPNMDGFAVANAINEQLDDDCRPTMLLLSSADLIRNDDALAAGFATILRKPVTRDELVANISRALADSSREQAESQKRAISDDTPLHFNKPVLVVEDNKVNQKVTSAMLAKLGVQFEIVEDGQQAVDAVASADYGLVLMDCQMPVMDGFEATRIILEAAEQTERCVPPIVALTANALQGDAERCYAAGMSDYMSKPFSIAELRAMLRKYANQQAAA